MFFNKIIVLILATTIYFFAKAQSVYVGSVFPTIDHSGDLSPKLGYGFYYFGAFTLINFNKPNINKDANFLLFYSEQSLSYNLTTKFSLTASYVYQRANAVYDNYVNENRFYLRAKYKHAIKKINLTHRVRFDGRFVQNRITNKTPFTYRVRYLIGADIGINQKLYVTAFEELFFNTVSNANPVYKENWAYAAFGIKLNEKIKLKQVFYILLRTPKK